MEFNILGTKEEGEDLITSGGVSESYGVAPSNQPNVFNILGKEETPLTESYSVAPEVTKPSEPAWNKYEQLNDEIILSDPELMGIVDRVLETRFGSRGTISGGITGVLGGATARFEGKSPEERLEIFNNYQRSFAGGQSVTTLNEVAFMNGATDEEKAALAEGYLLFDRKGNIFTGDVTWGETFDGVFDYARAALWDPVTVASLGVGKALSTGGTKAAAQALRVSAQQAYKTALQQGATQTAARAAAKDATRLGFASLGAKTVAKYSAVDFAANIGTDIAYQNVLIDAKAKEDYSYAQTGIAALGTLAIPSLIAVTKGVEALAGAAKSAAAKSGQANLFEAYVDVKKKFGGLGPEAITQAVRQRVNVQNVDQTLRQSFDDFANNLSSFTPWSQAKVDAGNVLNQAGVKLTAGENQNLFWKSLLFGDFNGTRKGLAESLQDAGFVYVPRSNDDTITNFVADAMSWLDDATVARVVSDFESSVGRTFDGQITTAAELSAAFKQRQSLFGSGLWDSKKVSDLLSEGGTTGQLAGALSRQKDEAHPEVGKYVLSVWKRLLTSHPGTTGLNVKGWASLSLANSVSDLVLGGIKFGEAAVWGALGKKDAYTAAINAGKGSVLGSLRRGYTFLAPNMTAEAAENYLMIKPELYEKMFRWTAGGVDGANALKNLNIDPTNKAAAMTEKSVGAIQNIMGVRLQDEVTKVLSFQTALEQGIMREYGQTFNEFMRRPDAYVEMFSPRFKERVDAWALNRTLRETSSKQWTQKKGRGIFLSIAKFVERLSANPVGGYAIPFGSFFNTSMATLGDYTGFNAIKHLTARGLDITGLYRGRFDFAEEEGAELLAKGIVGWSGVAYFLPDSIEKIEKGLAWNQEERDDGTIADLTFDFPQSYYRILSQASAHYAKDGEVPAKLRDEMFMVLGGQTFRQMDEGFQQFYQASTAVLGGEFDQAVQNGFEALVSFSSRIASGITRPLDPVNQAAILMSEDYTQIDRNQGNKFVAQSLRYVDALFGGLSGEAKATPTRGFDQPPVDPGRVLGGVRSTPAPNAIEKVLAATGQPAWSAVRWGGDAQVKNTMDGIIGPIMNGEAEIMLEKHPDFFTKPLAWREKRLEEVLKRSKQVTEQVIKYNFSSADKGIDLKRQLDALPARDVKRAMTYLGYEGDPLKILDEEGGMEKLEMLLYISKNYDSIFLE